MSFKAILWGARLLKQRRIPEDGVVDFRINVQPGFANSGWQDLTALWSSCQLPAAPKRFFRVGQVGRVGRGIPSWTGVTFTSVPCFHLRRYERDAVRIRKLLQQHFHTQLPGNTQFAGYGSRERIALPHWSHWHSEDVTFVTVKTCSLPEIVGASLPEFCQPPAHHPGARCLHGLLGPKWRNADGHEILMAPWKSRPWKQEMMEDINNS